MNLVRLESYTPYIVSVCIAYALIINDFHQVRLLVRLDLECLNKLYRIRLEMKFQLSGIHHQNNKIYDNLIKFSNCRKF